jgi:hypothetical protein
MNLFFIHHKNYIIDDTLTNVRDEINRIANRSWSYSSDNLTGKLNPNDTFDLSNENTHELIKWVEKSYVYLTGKITLENGKVKISVAIRPNSIFVVTFFIVLFLFVNHIIHPQSMYDRQGPVPLWFFAPFVVSLFILNFVLTMRTKAKFEKLLKQRWDK